MLHLLIVEDEINLRDLIKKNLELKGFKVTACSDGVSALAKFSEEKFDLLITDIMMPKMDGDTLIKKVKELRKDCPIIMLTALSTINDKKKSFLGGADDYLTKPIDFEELDLRICALLRRYQLVNQKNINYNDINLNFEEKSLNILGQHIDLTKKEFLLLYMLCSSPGRIFSRIQILDNVWGTDSESFERTVDVHINKLREKTEGSCLEISTVRGLGYKAVFK